VARQPALGAIALGFIPRTEILGNAEMLYIAIGILGATVMPHNLYLHSSIVPDTQVSRHQRGQREAMRFATIDSAVALMFALFINAAILIMAAATFHGTGIEDVGRHRRRLQAALAAARHDARASCSRVALLLLRPERHAHRNARRPDRDGRLHQPAHAPVAAAAW
jgi:NRAMP (natural resistance-associated macrophage protein)-like metal ion transporter